METYCDTASKAMNAEEYSVCRTICHVRQERVQVSLGYVNCNIRTSLTPEVCSKLISQIIKYVVSHKLIPFSYKALKLKSTADLTVEADRISRKAVQAKNHQRKIRDAYTILESIFKNISDEMEGSTTENAVEEVALLLGATTYSPREIYKILVPPLMYNELGASQQAVQSRGLLQWFRWFHHHQRLEKLHQQAVHEAHEQREETVKELLLSHNKLPILVYEVVCLSVWREKVLPLLMDAEPKSGTPMIPYTILIHEAKVIEFLEIILRYPDAYKALAESSAGLIDYVVTCIKLLLANHKNEKSQEEAEEDIIYKYSIFFRMGITCISILRNIIQHLESLPPSASVQVFSTHDLTVLFSNLIQAAPWNISISGKFLKYMNYEWKEICEEDKEKVSQAEAHVWLALQSLLLKSCFQTQHAISENQKICLLKLQKFLTEILLNQLPPLIELKFWLMTLAAGYSPSIPSKMSKVIPQVSQVLLDRTDNAEEALSACDETICKVEKIQKEEMNERFQEAFNLDIKNLHSAPDSTSDRINKKSLKSCPQCKELLHQVGSM